MDCDEEKSTEINCTICGISITRDESHKDAESFICSNCMEKINNFKIPRWVVIFIISLFGITVFGFYYFNRFYVSIRDYKNAIVFFQKNDLVNAEKSITNASKLVPDNQELENYKYYISAFKLYSENSLNDSLSLFEKYQKYNKDDKIVNSIVMYIQISNAFDRQDYKEMVDISSKLYTLNETDPFSILQYASALACEYTVSNESAAFNKSKELIIKALSYSKSKETIEYIERIEQRLKTKKVISSDEYIQLKKDGKI
jgi:tetratricopeptide (TPR) repeat protein